MALLGMNPGLCMASTSGELTGTGSAQTFTSPATAGVFVSSWAPTGTPELTVNVTVTSGKKYVVMAFASA